MDMNRPYPIGQFLSAVAGKRSSVVSVLAVIVILVTPTSLYFFQTSTGWKSIVNLIFAAIPVLALYYYYNHYTRTNPDYLRSESHQLNTQALMLLGDKSKTFTEIAGNLTSSGLAAGAPQLLATPGHIEIEGTQTTDGGTKN